MRSLLVLSLSMMVLSSFVAVGCAAPSVGSYDGEGRDLPERGDDDDDAKKADDDDDTTTTNPPKGSTTPPATKQTLTVASTGDGTGAVTSEPAGVTCAAGSCKGDFAAGTKLTLTAQAQPGSIFAGWTGGGCSGSTTCQTTTLATAATVTAQFITLAGTWAGTYSHTQSNGTCTFNNKGTLENTMAGSTTFTTAAAMAGFEIKQNQGCALVNTLPGTAPASPATVSGTTVTGTWNIKIDGVGGLPLPFTATIIGNKMSGKWTCTGCTGSFDITKQ